MSRDSEDPAQGTQQKEVPKWLGEEISAEESNVTNKQRDELYDLLDQLVHKQTKVYRAWNEIQKDRTGHGPTLLRRRIHHQNMVNSRNALMEEIVDFVQKRTHKTNQRGSRINA
jgi:hypothetical protein